VTAGLGVSPGLRRPLPEVPRPKPRRAPDVRASASAAVETTPSGAAERGVRSKRRPPDSFLRLARSPDKTELQDEVDEDVLGWRGADDEECVARAPTGSPSYRQRDGGESPPRVRPMSADLTPLRVCTHGDGCPRRQSPGLRRRSSRGARTDRDMRLTSEPRRLRSPNQATRPAGRGSQKHTRTATVHVRGATAYDEGAGGIVPRSL